MKSTVRILALAAFLLPGVVSAQGIRNSKHDLSSGSTATIKATGSNQICIFCHTPHMAQSTNLLWNHRQTSTATFSWGNDLDGNALTKTFAGTTLPTTLKNASKRCLGCHDGTVAIGDLTNGGGGTASILPVTALANRVDSAGKMLAAGGYTVGVGGNMGGNHPVSIPYAGQTAYNGLDSKATADGSVGKYYATLASGCSSASGLCTAGPATDGRSGVSINLLPNASGGTTNMGIECTSCHEPHNKTGFANFALIDNTVSSGLCRSCHNK